MKNKNLDQELLKSEDGAIDSSNVAQTDSVELSPEDRDAIIKRGMERMVVEYGDCLRKLAKE